LVSPALRFRLKHRIKVVDLNIGTISDEHRAPRANTASTYFMQWGVLPPRKKTPPLIEYTADDSLVKVSYYRHYVRSPIQCKTTLLYARGTEPTRPGSKHNFRPRAFGFNPAPISVSGCFIGAAVLFEFPPSTSEALAHSSQYSQAFRTSSTTNAYLASISNHLFAY